MKFTPTFTILLLSLTSGVLAAPRYNAQGANGGVAAYSGQGGQGSGISGSYVGAPGGKSRGKGRSGAKQFKQSVPQDGDDDDDATAAAADTMRKPRIGTVIKGGSSRGGKGGQMKMKGHAGMQSSGKMQSQSGVQGKWSSQSDGSGGGKRKGSQMSQLKQGGRGNGRGGRPAPVQSQEDDDVEDDDDDADSEDEED